MARHEHDDGDGEENRGSEGEDRKHTVAATYRRSGFGGHQVGPGPAAVSPTDRRLRWRAQVDPAASKRAPTTVPATAARGRPLAGVPRWWGGAAATCGGAVVLVVGDPGEVALVVAKATTWVAEVASRRPAPRPGVGKWLAGEPTEACWRTAPVAGSRP